MWVSGAINVKDYTETVTLAIIHAQTVRCSSDTYIRQVAQLSQRDRAAGWVSFRQKWKMIFCRKYRSIFNRCDVIGLQNYGIEFEEIKQNKGYCAVQGHSRSPTSVPIERPYATSY